MSATEQGINVKAVERIVCAAIKQRGEVSTGTNHSEVIKKLEALPDCEIYAWEYGFITSTGRFVTRQEAAKIAFKAGQTSVDHVFLYSQDLKGEK